MYEKEMYQALKTHLEKLGFTVKAEVLNTDITAISGDTLIIIEMKNSLNIKLLYQGASRQKLTDNVYVAIPKPNTKIFRSKSFTEKVHLVRRLNLGLIFVNSDESVETYIDPSFFQRRKNKKLKEKLLKEFELRKTSFNVGGVTKTKIITRYRERVLLIAYYLNDSAKTTKELRTLTNDSLCTDILQKNYYKWFDRVSRGKYILNVLGRKEIKLYEEIINELLVIT